MVTCLTCEKELGVDWDKLRGWVVRSSFPTLDTAIRASVVKYLASSEDTLYGISKNLGHPIQSVYKAIGTLTDEGYVVCEHGPSRKRRNVIARMCKLTELGKIASLVLLAPEVDRGLIASELGKVGEGPLIGEILECGFFREVFVYYLLRNISISFVEHYYGELAEIAKSAQVSVLQMLLVGAYVDLLEGVYAALLNIALEAARRLSDLKPSSLETLQRALERSMIARTASFTLDPCVLRIEELVRSDPKVRGLALKVFEEFTSRKRDSYIIGLARVFVSTLLLGSTKERAVETLRDAMTSLSKILENLEKIMDLLLAIREELSKDLHTGS